MIISSKLTFEATPLGEAGHVLILTPFSVFVRMQFLTVTPITGCSSWYLPRLPILMPWPGPQVTFSTFICWQPSPRETQSSPVLMVAPVILTIVDRPI